MGHRSRAAALVARPGIRRRPAGRGFLAAALLAVAASVPAQGPPPAGEEFQVNTTTAGPQRAPGASADAGGNFVVVWESFGQDGSRAGVFGQRYDADGTALGEEFQVNATTAGDQGSPAVAADSAGGFTVVWHGVEQDGSDFGVVGQRFDATGNRVGGEFQVNSYTSSSQLEPAVAATPAGGLVVLWNSFAQDGDGWGVFGQRFDEAGRPLGAEFQVNTTTAYDQFRPAAAVDEAGEFTVVWESWAGGKAPDVFARRYQADGAPAGPEFQVNSSLLGLYPAVAKGPAGDFVVAWEGWDGANPRIVQAQRFDPLGNAVGEQFPVGSEPAAGETHPGIAYDPAGNFVVVLARYTQGSHEHRIVGRAFDAGGVGGRDFQVNTSPLLYWGAEPVVAGDFVVVWSAYPGDPETGFDVAGQRYRGAGLFSDGFETGGTSAWDVTVD